MDGPPCSQWSSGLLSRRGVCRFTSRSLFLAVAEEMHRILAAEGIEVLPGAQPAQVQGLSGDAVTVTMRTAAGDRNIEG